MRIGFIDFVYLDYTPGTPLESPLGGMQSGLCHLSTALAARGHDITLINLTTRPGTYGGVKCLRLQNGLPPELLNSFDVVVSIHCAGQRLRQAGLRRPLVLWSGHRADMSVMQALGDASERRAWDRIVLKSMWQAQGYLRAFDLHQGLVRVIGNAVAPPFERLVRARGYFFECGRAPVLAYTSTPFRGLDILLEAFPLLRARIPGMTLRVYSSLAVYQIQPEQDPHRALYERCKRTPGVEYCGSLSQTALAQALAEADVFAYPSTFEETSCIALMEAMASGCLPICSDLGALRETAAGFAWMIGPAADSGPGALAQRFADSAGEAIATAVDQPLQWRERLERQRAFALERYTWSARSAEWEGFLEDLLRQTASGPAPGAHRA